MYISKDTRKKQRERRDGGGGDGGGEDVGPRVPCVHDDLFCVGIATHYIYNTFAMLTQATAMPQVSGMLTRLKVTAQV